MNGSYWDKVAKARMARRRLIKSGAALSLGGAALALVGCGDDDDDGGGGGGSEDAQTGGSLRFGMLVDITSLEPHLSLPDHVDTIDQVWERLTEYNDEFKPTGRLAESWEVSEDATEFVLHLRPGVKFHSGRALTSEDVKYSIARVADPDTSFAQLAVFARWYETVETPDPQTIVLKSSISRPSTFDFFEFFNVGDMASLEAATGREAIGTGPYMFKEWRQGDQFTLVRNPDYWEPNSAFLDEEIFHVGLDPQTMVSQFESGSLDVMRYPPIRDFVRLRDETDYQAVVHPSSGGYYMCGWSVLKPPFDDKRVRQALQWAMDRERFADTILQGTIKSYSLPWPESSIAFDEEQSQRYKFDLDKAKELLDEAGVTDLDFTLYLSTAFPEEIEFAEVYQADLATIGVKAEIQTEEVATFIDRINADPPNFEGMWFIVNSRANLGAPITQFLFGVTWRTDGDNNTGYQTAEFKDLIDKLTVESDPDEQRKLYLELNELVLEDNFIGILGSRPPRVALQENVRGVTHAPARDGFEYRYAWLDA